MLAVTTDPVNVLRRTALVFLPLAALACAVMYFLYDAELSAARSASLAEERKTVLLGKQRIPANLGPIVSDLQYLSEIASPRQSLATGGAWLREDDAENFRAFVAHKGIYDQLRILDLDGRERLRIDWRGGAPRIAPADASQDTS